MTKFDIFTNSFSNDIFKQKYSMNGQESWADVCKRVVTSVCGQYLNNEDMDGIYEMMLARKFIPAGRYLYASGRPVHQVNNCFLFRAKDSREGWAAAMEKATACLMTGGGIGFDYSKVREEGAIIKGTGGTSTGPIALMNMINEGGRYIMQGGQRRSAIWAGLNWNHKDIIKFMHLKDRTELERYAKQQDIDFPLPMEGTNISVIYDTEFFIAMEDKKHELHKQAKETWRLNCMQAFSTAEPGMSFNFLKDNESLRNACCEVTSEDDGDKCNLGTIWLPYVESREDFAQVVRSATKFLLCGGLYSTIPHPQVKEVGDINNRIGLGLGGIHEWLMARGKKYVVDQELHKWLNVYEQESDSAAHIYARELGVPVPKGKRAIAPTGTIGILAETTTGIEPLFCAAYKRTFVKDNKQHYQYVVDGAVKSLMEKGVSLENIQDSYDITFKERVKFQADVQNYVDMSISSTCNMPQWGSELNCMETLDKNARTLLKYAKRLRGFTCYPDGAITGQPLERVPLELALQQEGKVFEWKEDTCKEGVCGI